MMNFLNLVRSKPKVETVVSLPLQREVKIIGNICPADLQSYRDLRFHFHGKNPLLEVNSMRDLLEKYTEAVSVNSTTFYIHAVIEAALVPLIQRKLEELGLNIKWITVNV